MTREVSSPNYIKKIASAAYPAIAMLAGVELGVFTVLKKKSMNV